MITIDDANALASQIAARVGFPLLVEEVSWAGATSKCVRIANIEPGGSFSIGLELTPRRAEAFLVMDRFAGPVVRSMEASVTSDPGSWSNVLEAAAEIGVQVSVTVNGAELMSPFVGASTPWSSVEIECSKRILRTESAPINSLVDVGVVCLAMTLAAVVIEDETVADELEGARTEGAITHVVSTRYERSPVNRLLCIEYYGRTCWVCDLDFGLVYGELGTDFIEVHHRTPVSEIGHDYSINPRRDLVPLCSNCHSMVHRKNPPLTPVELRGLLGKAEKHILS